MGCIRGGIVYAGTEPVLFPGQLLDLVIQQGVDAGGAGLIRCDIDVGGPDSGRRIDQHDVVLQLCPVIRILRGKFQQLAWEKHGFRTEVSGTESGSDHFQVPHLAGEITQVVSMPNYATMEKIIAALT